MSTNSELVVADPSFLAGTKLQFDWSANSYASLKKCPRYYQLSKVDGWRGKGNVHLDFGTWFHEALELYDTQRAAGASHDSAECEAVRMALQVSFGWDSDHKFKNRDVLIRSIVWYLETYKDDSAKTHILKDGSPALELSFSFEPGVQIDGVPILLSGRIDKLVDFGELVYVLDRKTTGSTLSGYYFDQYSLDVQMSIYTLTSRIVYDTPVQGVIIDAAQTAIGFTAFSRGITTRSNGQLEEFLVDFKVYMETAARYAEANYWPMNEASCGNYGGCVFRNICNKDPAIREAFLKTDFEKRVFT